MRYCLDGDAPARMWMQWQTWDTAAPPPVPVDTACPGAGWEAQQVVAQGVTNASRPMFTYNAAQTTAISAVNVDLFVDMDPLRPPGETRLRSGTFLRNQNRAPTAIFVPAAAGGKVTLNGSPSSDPEGQPLTYVWMSSQGGGVPKKLGEGITCECPTNADAFPTQRLTPGTTYTLWLEVKDPGGLPAVSATQTVEIS
jgi:hypothetical protein